MDFIQALNFPLPSMYDILFTYIYHKKSRVYVGKYTVRPLDGMGFEVAFPDPIMASWCDFF